MRTRSPRCSSNMPIEALVRPFPSELTTPPVTKMCLVILIDFRVKSNGHPFNGYDTTPRAQEKPSPPSVALIMRRLAQPVLRQLRELRQKQKQRGGPVRIQQVGDVVE